MDGKWHSVCRCRARREAEKYIQVLMGLLLLDMLQNLHHVRYVGFGRPENLSKVPDLRLMSKAKGVLLARRTSFDLVFSVLDESVSRRSSMFEIELL